MTNCYFCGKELPQGSNYCASCDHKTITEDPFVKTFTYKKRSALWYLLPIFIGIVGGVITYFIIKNSDPLKGKYCLIIGGVVTVVGYVINWLYAENPAIFTNIIKI